jgi:serine/threonine protein phosphatase PrpC
MSDEDRRASDRSKLTRKTLKSLRTIDLTEDHKASSEKEKKRMKLKGGFVANGRVFGVLAVRRLHGARTQRYGGDSVLIETLAVCLQVARAFGDRSLKMSPQEYQIRKIKGSNVGVMKRNRNAVDLSDESEHSSDDETSSKDGSVDDVNGDESGAVTTGASTSTDDEAETTASGEVTTTASTSEPEMKRRLSRRVLQHGKELNTGLPFDNDELWSWVESRMDGIKALTDFEAEEKARKAEKKAAKEKARSGEGESEAGQGEGGGAEGEKGKGKKGKDSYEAMTDKEMKRRQDKALKKRSKQIKKEREQLKEKERKVKEMVKIQERRGNAGEGVVVALPDIDCRILSPDDRFILIASDGTHDPPLACTARDPFSASRAARRLVGRVPEQGEREGGVTTLPRAAAAATARV